MSSLEQLGAFAASYRPDERARAAARLHAADTVGAWIAGAGTREGQMLAGLRAPGLPLAERIAINVAQTRLSEIDDIHLGSMITPAAVATIAALVIGAERKAPADELAAAIVAGYEAMIRFGAAIDGPTVLYRGIWPTYFAAPLGVAAVAARLLRLDAVKSAHALANAFIALTPGTGHHAAVTTARWLAAGQAAARGYQAAQAAQAGFTSDLKLLDGEFLKNVYGIAPNTAALRDGLGDLALHLASYKPWCAARQTMAATQALKEIIAEGVAPDAITAIEVAVLPPHLKMIDHGVTAGDRFSHLTSVQYQMAVAALLPDAAYDVAGPSGAIAPALQSFMARIKVAPDEALLREGYPARWAARIAVTTAAGRREKLVTQVPGDPGSAYGESELRDKFARVTSFALHGANVDGAWSKALSALDRPADVLALAEGIGAH